MTNNEQKLNECEQDRERRETDGHEFRVRLIGESPVIPSDDPYRDALSDQLDVFKEDCMQKYDKGRLEHPNTTPADIDFEKEIHDETKDLVIYSLLKKICHTPKGH